MTKYFLIIITLLCWSVSAYAEAPDLCRAFVKHTPDEDVAYQPGVDVNGNSFVPADISGVDYTLNDPIEIPMQIELLEYLDQAPDVEGLDLESNVSAIQIYRDGRVLYNGQDIQNDVAALCENKAKIDPPKDGQMKDDGIISGVNDGVLEGQYPPKDIISVEPLENTQNTENE